MERQGHDTNLRRACEHAAGNSERRRRGSALEGLLQPSTVLPTQFFSRPVTRSEQRLMCAVLADALGCFQKYAFATQPAGRRLFRESSKWIYGYEPDWPFSFQNICETLGVDPAYVREGLNRWLRRPLAQRAAHKQTQAETERIAACVTTAR